jgi:uncharacterized protein (DUF1330 family)
MAAYLFVTIKAHDLAWAEAYQANVPAIMERHGGGFVAVSDHVKRYEGTGSDPDRAALMMFPSVEAIEAFVTDPEYAPYRAARVAASTGDAFAFSAS